MAQNLKSGDKVMIIAGDNKGKTTTILKMDTKSHKAILEGIEVRERHMKKSYLNPKGGKKEIQQGLDLSNLKLVEAAKPAKKAEKPAKKAAKADDKKAKKGAK